MNDIVDMIKNLKTALEQKRWQNFGFMSIDVQLDHDIIYEEYNEIQYTDLLRVEIYNLILDEGKLVCDVEVGPYSEAEATFLCDETILFEGITEEELNDILNSERLPEILMTTYPDRFKEDVDK